jgi:hypothetical protein
MRMLLHSDDDERKRRSSPLRGKISRAKGNNKANGAAVAPCGAPSGRVLSRHVSIAPTSCECDGAADNKGRSLRPVTITCGNYDRTEGIRQFINRFARPKPRFILPSWKGKN